MRLLLPLLLAMAIPACAAYRARLLLHDVQSDTRVAPSPEQLGS